jgi:hypothetical protein
MPFAPAVTSPTDRVPRRDSAWLWGTLVLLFLLAPAVFTVPRQVNAVAWLAGAGRPDTFTGYSHVTDGTIGTIASTNQVISWPARVPLNRPVSFRDPVWGFMSPRLDETIPDALVGVALGLVFDSIALIALIVFAARARKRAARVAT